MACAKNEDLERLIRARMEKTGESYTAARAHLVGDAGDSRRRPPPLPENRETPVTIYFNAEGPAKSTVSIQLSGLPDPQTAQEFKTAWGARLERLAAVRSA